MLESHLFQTFDLLSEKKSECFQDENGKVRGQIWTRLNDEQELLKFIAHVEQRTVGKTNKNDESSRSHCITTFELWRIQEPNVRINSWRFYDMAGSERAHEAHNASANNK